MNDTVDDLSAQVAAAPDDTALRGALAAGLAQAGRDADALAHYQTIIEQHPDHPTARGNAALLLIRLGRTTEGAALLRDLAADRPIPLVLYNLALAEQALGNLDTALATMDQVLQTDPDFRAAAAGRAQILERLGRHAEAAAAVAPLIDQANPPVAATLTYASLARGSATLGPAADHLVHALTRDDLTPQDRRALHAALARLEDRRGNVDAAFAAAANANRLDPRVYDPAATDARFANLIERFTSAAFAKQSSTPVGPRMIFIVGMPRSGTTLVEQVLDCHPAVAAQGERRELGQIAARLGDDPATWKPTDVAAAAADYVQELSVGADQTMATDKMPRNFEHLGHIAVLFPDAAIVHCTRDPRDTCLSCYFQNFVAGNEFAGDLAALGHFYRAYLGLMDHWRAVLPTPVFDVSYEKLVADPETEIRALVDHVGLPWDDACLAPHQNPRVANTASYQQVREPIYQRSIGRWRHYRHHLQALFAALEPPAAQTAKRAGGR